MYRTDDLIIGVTTSDDSCSSPERVNHVTKISTLRDDVDQMEFVKYGNNNKTESIFNCGTNESVNNSAESVNKNINTQGSNSSTDVTETVNDKAIRKQEDDENENNEIADGSKSECVIDETKRDDTNDLPGGAVSNTEGILGQSDLSKHPTKTRCYDLVEDGDDITKTHCRTKLSPRQRWLQFFIQITVKCIHVPM